MKKIMLLLVVLIFTACGNNIEKKESQNLSKLETEKVYKIKNYDVFSSNTWMKHLEEDIMPFWTSKDAIGDPMGKFISYRLKNGELYNYKGIEDNDIYPRMMGRQIYAYSMAFFLTGNEKYLTYAKKGTEYLMKYGYDPKDGSWHELIKNEKAVPMRKNSQNDSYSLMGPASYYFITRDKQYEKLIMDYTKNLFDSEKYWNNEKNRVRMQLKKGSRYNTDLTAHLDQINAYMLLVQSIMPEKNDREELLNDMVKLGDIILKQFKTDIYFSRIANDYENIEQGIDYGHTIKSYWILQLLDRRLKEKRYSSIMNNIETILNEAYNNENGLWQDNINWKKDQIYNSSWWTYAELNQAAMISNKDGKYDVILDKTLNNWLNYFVDHQYFEVYSNIDNNKLPRNEDGKYYKENSWKNGFHSVEHAMFNYIYSKMREKESFDCYYAVKKGYKGKFVAKPYILDGDEIGRELLGEIEIDGEKFIKIRVSFENVK